MLIFAGIFKVIIETQQVFVGTYRLLFQISLVFVEAYRLLYLFLLITFLKSRFLIFWFLIQAHNFSLYFTTKHFRFDTYLVFISVTRFSGIVLIFPQTIFIFAVVTKYIFL